jgi:hypothetical protein
MELSELTSGAWRGVLVKANGQMLGLNLTIKANDGGVTGEFSVPDAEQEQVRSGTITGHYAPNGQIHLLDSGAISS